MNRIRTSWVRLGLLLILTVPLLVACARALPAPREAPAPKPVTAKEAFVAEETTAVTTSPALPRRIIYEADLELVVEDTQAAADSISAIVKELGGYVAETSLYRREDTLTGTMTVRVPQERFQEALQRFRALAIRVERESIRTNDVTQEYVDLQARLKNLEATEKELRALLSEVRKETKSASDIIEVYRELTRVRSEIEQIKGRLQVLDTLTNLATIRITLVPYELSRPISGRWDPRVTLHQAWRNLIRGLRFLVDLAIYLIVVVLPLAALALIPTFLVIYLLRKGFQRLRKGRTPPQT